MQRKLFIDWARGFAVVAMVLWHTADGWIEATERTDEIWRLLRFVGGLAAPAFLFMAGAGLGLAAREDPPVRRPLAVDLSRGLEIMLFGYLLRLQAWLVDAGAVLELHLARAWLPLGFGYGLLWLSLRALGRGHGRPAVLALVGALSCTIGLAQVPLLAPGRFPRLLQVDVLQAIGAALVLLTLGERTLRLLQRPALTLGLAVALTLATGPIYDMLPGPLPVPLAAYLGKFTVRPEGPPTALFPLFPWLAYACAGAALGALLRRRAAATARVVVWSGLAGAVLALVTSESHAFVQGLIKSHGWTVYPLRTAFRVGLVLVLVLVGWLWANRGRGRLLLRYGRASLRVYWAHLLVAYGVLGTPWHKQLPMEQWAVGVALLLVLMWLLAGAWHRSAPPTGRVPPPAAAST